MKYIRSRCFLCTLVMATAFLSNSTYADGYVLPSDTSKWTGHIEIEGKKGNQRTLGESNVFLPLLQDETSMLFLDLRGVLDNKTSLEGNIGLGYRKMLDAPFLGQKWIWGGYAFLDARRTPNNNNFFQATIGAELLSEDYDFRFNSYIPQSIEKDVDGTNNVSGFVSGTQLRISGLGNDQERALPGIDAEVGIKLPILEGYTSSIRAYAGGFYFNADGYDKVVGPRGRIEASWSDIKGFGDGSRFTLGAEIQHDDVRGKTNFAIARLRIPLQRFQKPSNKKQRRLTPLEKRMTSSIVRDVDIVSNTRVGVSIDEAATLNVNGQQISNVIILDATDNIPADVTAAGAGTTIILDGSAGDINLVGSIVPESNQNIIGADIEITGNFSGFSGAIGARPNILGPGQNVLHALNPDVTIQNVDVSSSSIAILVNAGGNNLNVENVNISNATIIGLVDVFASNVTFNNINITDGVGAGVFMGFANDIILSNINVVNIVGTAFEFNTVSAVSGVGNTSVGNAADCVLSGGAVSNVTLEINGMSFVNGDTCP